MITGPVLALAVLGVVVLAAGTFVRWSAVVSGGFAVLGVAYVLALTGQHGIGPRASGVVAGVVLLVAGEATFSLVARGSAPVRGLRGQAGWLAGCAAGAAVVSGVVAAAAALPLGRSLPGTIAGTVAAVGAVWGLTRLARRGE